MATATQSLKDLVAGSSKYFDNLIGDINDLIGESRGYLRHASVKKYMSATSQSGLKKETDTLEKNFDKLNDALADVPVTLELGNRTVHGIARGVDEHGALIIEHGGSRERFLSGHLARR